ncbi:MAG: arabinose-5-phosphate isomerase, partial [Chitinophagaceae bacterium]
YLRVEDIAATNEKPAVLANASLKKVIVEITEKRLGVTAVVDDSGKLIGIITDGDLRRMLEKTTDISNLLASDILSPKPITISSQALAVEALDLLRKNDISQLVVAESGQYAGILHLHDLIREGIV